MKNFLQNFIIIVISSIFSLGLSELIFRFCDSYLLNSSSLNLKPSNTLNQDKIASKEKELFIVGAGESTMIGEPYDSRFTMLDLIIYTIKKAFPGVKIQKQLVAGKGKTLNQLYPQIVETLSKKPSFLVLYVGHNDFLGALSHSQKCSQDTSWVYTLFRFSTLFKRIYNYYQATGIDSLPVESQRSFIDEPIVCEKQWEDLIENYRHKILSLAKRCQELRIPIILIFPAGNEIGFNPNRSVYTGPKDKLNYFNDNLIQANNYLLNKNLTEARKLFEESVSFFPNFAEAWYRLGLIYLELKLTKEAEEAFRKASDNDGFPFRALPEQLIILKEAQKRYDAIVIDGRSVISNASPTGLLDNNVFHDMHHPNIIGYRALAEAVTEQITQILLAEKSSPKNFKNIPLEEIFTNFKFSTADWMLLLKSRIEWMKRIKNISYVQFDRIRLLLEYIYRFEDLCKKINSIYIDNFRNSIYNNKDIQYLENQLKLQYQAFNILDERKLQELISNDLKTAKNYSQWQFLDFKQNNMVSVPPLTAILQYGTILNVTNGKDQDGRPIMVNGKVYTDGFAAHPSHISSIIVFRPEKKYQSFQSMLAINDTGSVKSSVECQIIANGEIIYRSPLLRWHQQPINVEVDIKEASDLVLKCDPTIDGNAYDHVVWLNPSFSVS